MPDYTKWVKGTMGTMTPEIDCKTGEGKVTTKKAYLVAFPWMRHNDNIIAVNVSVNKEYPVKDYQMSDECTVYHEWNIREYPKTESGFGEPRKLSDDEILKDSKGRTYTAGEGFQKYANEMLEQLEDAKFGTSYENYEKLALHTAYVTSLPSLVTDEGVPSYHKWKKEYFDDEMKADIKIGFADACNELKEYIKSGGECVGRVKTLEDVENVYGKDIKEGERLRATRELGGTSPEQPSVDTEVSLGS